jgi:hypothetical protein
MHHLYFYQILHYIFHIYWACGYKTDAFETSESARQNKTKLKKIRPSFRPLGKFLLDLHYKNLGTWQSKIPY